MFVLLVFSLCGLAVGVFVIIGFITFAFSPDDRALNWWLLVFSFIVVMS